VPKPSSAITEPMMMVLRMTVSPWVCMSRANGGDAGDFA
jgi:hypothetical protein